MIRFPSKPTLAAVLVAGASLVVLHGSMLRNAAAAGPAPVDVPMTDLVGNKHTLADWSGRFRLVNFWATWCGPCREEMPLLQRTAQRLADANFRIIGIALDRPEAVSGFKERLGITYPLVTLDFQAAMDMMGQYGNASAAVPFSVLLSPEGEVLASHLGAFSEAQLDALLEKHLEMTAPGTELTGSLDAAPAGGRSLRGSRVAMRRHHLSRSR